MVVEIAKPRIEDVLKMLEDITRRRVDMNFIFEL